MYPLDDKITDIVRTGRDNCMNGHFSLGDIHPIKYFYTFAVCLGLIFFTVTQNDDIPWTVSFIQWQLQSIIPITLLISSHIIWAKFNFFLHLGHWLRLVISGITGTLLTTPFALLIEILLLDESWPDNWFYSLAGEWAGMSVPVIVSWLLMNAPLLLGMQYRKQVSLENSTKNPSEETIIDENAVKPNFLQMIDIENLSEIFALSSELHYLDIILESDHRLILYSLSTAIEELPDDMGMQVHRSHWVAYSAIKKLNKQGRQGTIVLRNNKEIPVSRSYLKAISEKMSY